MLLLEAADKRRFLLEAYRLLSNETTSGILSRGFFWWLTPLLTDGWKRVLAVGDLFAISEKIESQRVKGELAGVWGNGLFFFHSLCGVCVVCCRRLMNEVQESGAGGDSLSQLCGLGGLRSSRFCFPDSALWPSILRSPF